MKSNMNLLLFSNSTNAGEEYLSYTLPYIRNFIGNNAVKALFIPYAGVSITWDEYFGMVHNQLVKVGIELNSIHKEKNPVAAIEKTELIIIGGGNTFNLLKTIQEKDLIPVIQKAVYSGIPYIGWSAGSNLTCPTIRTTNDMPIVEPENFEALGLIPFQINPHYLDANPDGHAGETREMRIEEFLIANQEMFVAGLREGTMFLVEDDAVKLQGDKKCRIFKHGEKPKELTSDDDFSFLIQ
jgi:dipeptidase E